MKEIPFKCNSKHAGIRTANGVEFKANYEFPLRVWETEEGRPAKGVVVMINGFLEGCFKNNDTTKLPDHYEVIAQQLCQDNICSILLPLPFHFERSLDFNGHEILAPLVRLDNESNGSGEFLYEGGYTQIKADLIQLVKQLNENPIEFNLALDFELHLLGYSIGGATALGFFLDDNYSNTIPAFNSISILLSNYNISNITPQQIRENPLFRLAGFKDEMWARILADLNNVKDDLPDYFRFVMWGDKFESVGQKINMYYEETDKQKLTRLMFLNGLKDKIFDPPSLVERDFSISYLLNEYNLDDSLIKLIMIDSRHDMNRTKWEIAKEVASFVSNNKVM